jgi:O-acetyl-ADP-ribose deacetylase (regulator of RNase III)
MAVRDPFRLMIRMRNTVRIVLSAYEKNLAEAFRSCCADLQNVQVHEGSIFEVECDAVVSPANSFGFMDGGIDAQYMDRFGEQVQDRVRMSILREHNGELLVGAATIVETDDPKIPYLIAAPTMRVPMWLGPETVNPYLAARAVLNLVRQSHFSSGSKGGERIGDHVEIIAFPGLGTGVGRVPADICARQIRTAIQLHMDARPKLPQSWSEASEDHQLLYTDKPVRLQR